MNRKVIDSIFAKPCCVCQQECEIIWEMKPYCNSCCDEYLSISLGITLAELNQQIGEIPWGKDRIEKEN